MLQPYIVVEETETHTTYEYNTTCTYWLYSMIALLVVDVLAPTNWLIWVFTVLMGAYLVVVLIPATLTANRFRKAGTALLPFEEATALVTSGLNRYSRNPMYLGIVLMLVGVALATGSLPCYLASLAFFLIIDSVFCPYEEDKLEQAFGPTYSRYRGTVRRWL